MAKKSDLQDELTELGIEFDPNATNAELEALLAEAKGEEDEEEADEAEEEAETEEDEAEEEEEEEEPAKGDVAAVHYRGRVREYTRAIHGKDFAKLAKEFAGKMGGKVVMQ